MRTLLFTVLFLFTGFPLFSQQEGVPANEDIVAEYEDLFTAEEPLCLTLKFDITAFKNTKHQDVYHDAVMVKMVNDDLQVTHPVQIKARETIRQKFCAMPPMWLKIGTSGIKTDSLQDVFRMNMILPCKNADQYEPYVLREYLAYRIYNIITPLSYRVRLVRLSIIDTGKGNEVTEEWAFLQEPDELMSQRLKAKNIMDNELTMSNLNPKAINSMSMFQYMIGNADYSVTGRHNLKIMALNLGKPSGFLPVPYDFDYSGLVNTDYAVPAEPLGTSSIRERYYLGPCRPEQVHQETIQKLAQFEDEIMEHIKDFEYLDDEEKDDMIGYLDSYFKESRESWFIDRKIAPTCR